MNKLSLFALIIMAAGVSVHAQSKLEQYDSKALMEDGYKWVRQGELVKAIEAYLKIDRNDTNYHVVLTELSYSYLNSDQPEKAVALLQDAASVPDKVLNPDQYINWGTALELIANRWQDSLGTEKRIDSLTGEPLDPDYMIMAVEKYSEGIERYPMYASLYYNRAVTHVNRGAYEQGMEDAKMAMQVNPFHARSHFLLGQLALEEGDVVRAMLSFYTFLMLAVDEPQALDFLATLDAFLGQSMNDLEQRGLNLGPGDNFDEIERIVKSRVALNKNYKLKSPLDFPVIRQVQVMLESITYKKNDDGFWMQYYVPFYEELWKEDKFRDFSLLLLVNSDNEAIQAEVKKRRSSIIELNDWITERWASYHLEKTVMVEGKLQTVEGHIYGREYLEAIGHLSEKTNELEGEIYIYEPDGSMSVKGTVSPKGERTGTWTAYYSGGDFLNKVEWKNGERSGPFEEYYRHGTLSTKGGFKNGMFDGVYTEYYRSGGLKSSVPYTNGEYDGMVVEFFPTGDTSSVAYYEKSEVKGPVRWYYQNGTLETEVSTASGKRNGSDKKFFPDGQLKSVIEYKDDLMDGDYTLYYPNGMLKEEGKYKDDKLIGEIKEYYPDGKLFSVIYYDNSGKMNGVKKEYDLDGSLYYEWDFKSGEITGYRYYDKKGNVIIEDKRTVLKFPYKAYWEDKTRRFEGDYNGSQQNGPWTYYDRYGNIQSVNNFKDDALDGTYTKYFAHGQIDYTMEYRNGEPDGYYQEFWSNGVMYAQGYYANGGKDGTWMYYYRNGKPRQQRYYLNDKEIGWQVYFDVEGKKEEENYILDGKVAVIRYYDTAGVLSSTHQLLQEKTRLQEFHYNGQLYSDIPFINQSSNGLAKWYTFDGKLETEGVLVDGERDGTWKWYYPNGNVSVERNYQLGSQEGKGMEYYPDGKLEIVRTYMSDEEHGELTYYHRNGNVHIRGEKFWDEWHGEVVNTDPSGNVQLIRYYFFGKLLGYSYLYKNGDKVPMIPVDQGNGIVRTFYLNGKPALQSQYEKGLLSGTYKEFYANGNIWEEAEYVNGRLEGELKAYYEDGNVEEFATYSNGSKEGMYRRYFPNGKLEMEATYTNGKLHGPAKYYNESGELIYEVLYYDDKVAHEKKY